MLENTSQIFLTPQSMKRILITLSILLGALTITAQDYNEYLEAARKHLNAGNIEKAQIVYNVYVTMTGNTDSQIDDALGNRMDNKVFTSVEQMPQFPGGDAGLLRWVSLNIIYPETAMKNDVQGRVVVQFVVTKTGSVGGVKVVRSVDPELDREAVRVVKTLPNFIPGKMNGQSVNVWYTLPINFKLQGV